MTIQSGFFNSINGDRKYDATWFAQYFASFIGNGVFPNPSTGLQVVEDDNMNIVVKAGKGWINGYYIVNDNDYVLTLDNADGVLKRIDRVVMRLNYLTRQIEIGVKKGAFASEPTAPTLQRDSDAYELALADILINNGAVAIVQANITDTRLNNDLCGIVHGLVEQVDTTTIFEQYNSWFGATKNSAELELENFQSSLENAMNQWMQQERTDFEAWFLTIQDILDENVAATLTAKITTLEQTADDLESQITTHLAETATVKHKANQISFVPPTGMSATNVQDGLAEAFLLGNSRKEDLVDKLLLVDASLPITDGSSWAEVLNAISMISTGKKWASGIAMSSATSNSFTTLLGNNLNRPFVEVVNSFGFIPSIIILQGEDNGFYSETFYTVGFPSGQPGVVSFKETRKSDLVSQAMQMFKPNVNSCYINANGFKLPVGLSSGVSNEFKYLAIE